MMDIVISLMTEPIDKKHVGVQIICYSRISIIHHPIYQISLLSKPISFCVAMMDIVISLMTEPIDKKHVGVQICIAVKPLMNIIQTPIYHMYVLSKCISFHPTFWHQHFVLPCNFYQHFIHKNFVLYFVLHLLGDSI